MTESTSEISVSDRLAALRARIADGQSRAEERIPRLELPAHIPAQVDVMDLNTILARLRSNGPVAAENVDIETPNPGLPARLKKRTPDLN